VAEVAAMLGLTDRLKRKARGLTADLKQKISLGRGMVRQDVSAILFDEPLTVIDPHLKWQLRRKLKQIHHELRLTLIYVTHDQVEALTMGDRIVVMKDGHLQQLDSPQNLYDKPANMFVAGFIGSPSMNFMPGKVESDGEGLYIADSGFKLRVPREHEAKLASRKGQPVVFGIRPEDIEVQEFAEQEWRNATVQSRVEVLEPLGSEIQLHATTADHAAGGGKIAVEEGAATDIFVARVDPRVRVMAGDVIPLAFNMANMHAFDPQTQEAVV
jgi:multiple sugar transport system ATP-binding protein